VDRRIDSVYLITSLGHAMSDIADPVRLCPGSASDRTHARGDDRWRCAGVHLPDSHRGGS